MNENSINPTKQIISMLAHDLRNPLNNIIGFSNLIEELTCECQNPALIKYINIIRQEAEHANKLINSVAEWSRNEHIIMEDREQIEIFKILDNAKKEHEVLCVGA